MSVHNFTVKNNKGEEISLERFKGKVLLIVNTASECGFTPQYQGLQELSERLKEDFAVLAFPSNQFGSQEPGSDEEIAQFCDLKFKIGFPLFSKIEVNGSGAHPLFEYLKESLPGVLRTKKVKWNFTKFLVDREGRPVKRYAPTVKPVDIEEDIKKLL